MAKIVDPDQSLRTFLVFGGDTALGQRIIYYLQRYADSRNEPVQVVNSSVPMSMENIQKNVWTSWTGEHGSQRPTMVINVPRASTLDKIESDPMYGFDQNTTPAAYVAVAARSAAIPMVQISSDQVFSCDDGPYAEGDTPSPVNVYGVTLMAAERAVRELHPWKWENLSPVGATIIRLSWLYGKDIETAPKFVRSGDVKPAVVADVTFTPSFVGEAAFLIARNLIEAPHKLAAGVIHCGPAAAPISWADLMIDHGDDQIRAVNREDLPSRTKYALGLKGGLKPSLDGWGLPSSYAKGYSEFQIEADRAGYMEYW